MTKSYRILSIEACDIYAQEKKNGEAVGYRLPQENTFGYYVEFKNKLDYSLDTVKLKRVYNEFYGKPLCFKDKYGNDYTLAVININFNYTYDPDKKTKKVKKTKNSETKNTKQLREKYYKEGFNLNGVHYVRYKRSAGSSRQGRCLFIDGNLYEEMTKWSECGLSKSVNLASWEAYKALSLSAINRILKIPLNGILFVKDRKSKFTEEVVSVTLNGDGKLDVAERETEICNDIWDGESLLDESLFTGAYGQMHMLLLRNRFFKSCAFKTRLKKWISDKGITLEALKSRGCVTLATDIDQIVMVTTPNSLKYLKFFEDGLTESNIKSWAAQVAGSPLKDDPDMYSTFGVVKWDKSTKYFGGKMVRSSYQFLNTVCLNGDEATELLSPSIEYLKLIRKDISIMRHHFKKVCRQEPDDIFDEGEDGESEDGVEYADDKLVERAEVLFKLMNINDGFEKTSLYTHFRDLVVNRQKEELLNGHLLLHGTNATLFGNGPELLKYIAGEELISGLGPAQIRCEGFGDGQKLLCARSPHITMGNLYCVENKINGDIWEYFDLGTNIVCVNAIGENIMQRLNGCDYDSDSMLITDESILIEKAQKYGHLFKVPVCNVPSENKNDFSVSALVDLDYETKGNKIGEIVNLSQKLNSIIWDKLNSGESFESIKSIYLDVCKLAVLSGIEIDKAKRTFAVNVGRELELIRSAPAYAKYANPEFFIPIHKRKERENDGETDDGNEQVVNAGLGGEEPEKEEKKKKKERDYAFYNTAMDFIYRIASAIDFRKGCPAKAEYVPISSMLRFEPIGSTANLQARDDILAICENYKKLIRDEHRKSGKSEVIYDNIRNLKAERDEKIGELLSNEDILMLVLKHREQKIAEATKAKGKTLATDWYLYAPILNSGLFESILNESREKLYEIRDDDFGGIDLYGFRYSKV